MNDQTGEDNEVKVVEKRQNRTRRKSQDQGAITSMPENLAIPTLAPFQNALTTLDTPAAHLWPISPDTFEELKYENGVMYFRGLEASTATLIDQEDNEVDLAKLDLITLRGLYSVILQDISKMAEETGLLNLVEKVKDPQFLTHNVRIHIPDFLRMQGYAPNLSEDSISYTQAKFLSYQNILGIMKEEEGGRTYYSPYPVMLYAGTDTKTNDIIFTSPYMNALILTILNKSIQRDKKKVPKTNSAGKPFLLPSHSYLIKSTIMKEKNWRAAEIVFIIVTLIEQAGDNVPHILAQTIVDRCPELKAALNRETPAHRNQILKRAFSKAWELLETKTRLREYYKDIVLPNPKDSANIPTNSTLNMKFEFPHKGKKRSADPANLP